MWSGVARISIASGATLAVMSMIKQISEGLYASRRFDMLTHSITRAEAQAHTEMRLTRVFQSAPFGIATADAGGRIVTANAAGQQPNLNLKGFQARRAAPATPDCAS